MNLSAALAGFFRFEEEAILSDPVQLGAFLSLAAEIAELEPRAREAAERLALAGTSIPGWTLIRTKGARYVDVAHIRDLLLNCPAKHLPELAEAIAKVIGNVGEKRWETLCDALGRLDGDQFVTQCGTKVFLRRKSAEEGNNQPK